MFNRTSRIAVLFAVALFAACGDTRSAPAGDGSVPSVAEGPPPPTAGVEGDAFGTGSGSADASGRVVMGGGQGGGIGGIGGGSGGGLAGMRTREKLGAPGSRLEQGGLVAAAGTSTSPQAAADAAPSMVIRTGNASVEVKSVDTAMVRLRALAQSLGGLVANESVSGGREQPRTAMIELKIPSARFDQATAGLPALGRVEQVSVNTEDVGEQYVDIQARLANAKRLESRLIDLVRTHTGRLQDLLAVERELARVREEIERFEGRARFLRSRVAMSSLSVHLHEPRPIIGSQPGPNRIANAVRGAWRNFVGFIAGLIESMGVLIPIVAIGALIWWLVRRIRRSRPARSDAEDRGATGEG